MNDSQISNLNYTMSSSKRKIKKVLLFIPPAFTFKHNIDINPIAPLGLAYLGAVLEQRDIEVRIFDCLAEGWDNRIELSDNIIRIGSSFERVGEIIADYMPDIVGVNNLFTTQRKNAHEIYRLAKEINKDIICIAGGAHPTVLPELVLADKNVDYVVIGEGEETIVDIVDVMEGRNEILNLDGIAYREDGCIRIRPKTKFIQNLDKLPFPARHLLNMEKYFSLKMSHGTRKKRRFSPLISSRGCPTGCTFCSAHKVWGKRFRCHSPEYIINEMEYIKEKYAIEEIMFEDDNLTLDNQRAEKILDLMIERKLDLVWDTPNGISVFALNERLIDKMKQSGCYKLNLAVETGNQYVMDKIIKKPIKLERVKSLINYSRKIGLDVNIFLIVGMPGETESQIWDTFYLAKDLKIYRPFFSIATPYPGSELYDICLEKGYLRHNFSLDDLYIRSFPLSTENWSSEKLKQIFLQGRKYLLVSYFKEHSFKFLISYFIRFCADPLGFIRKLYTFFKRQGENF